MRKKSYWPYIDMFAKYKRDCKIFFETGTHFGDSVNDALELNFEKVITVELNTEYYNSCVDRFKSDPDFNKIHMFHGSSSEHMAKMLELVDDKAMFWLDAHVESGNPLYYELEKIKEHPIKTHTIIIDDIPLYFGNGDGLRETIRSINRDYIFKFENCVNHPNPNYHLVAFIS